MYDKPEDTVLDMSGQFDAGSVAELQNHMETKEYNPRSGGPASGRQSLTLPSIRNNLNSLQFTHHFLTITNILTSKNDSIDIRNPLTWSSSFWFWQLLLLRSRSSSVVSSYCLPFQTITVIAFLLTCTVVDHFINFQTWKILPPSITIHHNENNDSTLSWKAPSLAHAQTCPKPKFLKC